MIKDFKKDYYSGLKGIYFYKILRTIIALGRLDRTDKIILDFGSGTGKLKELLGKKVINFDVISSQSDVADWRRVKFDYFVVNEVLYLLTAKQIKKLLNEIKKINPGAHLIVGIARENLVSKVLAILAGEPDAHADNKTAPKEQVKLLGEHLNILEKKTVFGLCDVYLLAFKTNWMASR